ncbi:MAG: DUF6702 family protein [Chitinophagaceae bacterium]
MTRFLNKWPLLALMPFFLSLTVSSSLTAHPFHVSTTEINQNLADKTLEISCHVFTDDFEAAIMKETGSKADFSRESMKVMMDSLTKKYILNHLSLKVNNRNVTISYVGWEKENEGVFVYLQVDGISVVTQVDLVNTILYNLFDDQMNIVHVKVNGERKSHKMSFPEKSLSLVF